jgi:hypothetical protein
MKPLLLFIFFMIVLGIIGVAVVNIDTPVSVSGFVPYTGATDDLDMGNYNITTTAVFLTNLSIYENSTTIILDTGGKDLCLGNCTG